jgi:Lar family restriction alleviation protein
VSTDQTLKPCPFCGHVGLEFSEGSTFRWLAYSCTGCGMGTETRVQTMGSGSPEEWRAQAERDAIKEWNTRTEPEA